MVRPPWLGRRLALATGALEVPDSRAEKYGMLDAGSQLAPSNQIGGSLSWNGIILRVLKHNMIVKNCMY